MVGLLLFSGFSVGPPSKIVHSYLLFPAIERLARGMNAPMLEALSTYLRQPFMALVYSVHMVPAMLLKRVFQLAVRMHYGAGKETFVQNILSLTSPSVMRAIIDTTQDILKKVGRRDDDAIARYTFFMNLFNNLTGIEILLPTSYIGRVHLVIS